MLPVLPLSARPVLFRCSRRPHGIEGARLQQSHPYSRSRKSSPANKPQTYPIWATFLFVQGERAVRVRPAVPVIGAQKILRASSCRYSRNLKAPSFAEILATEAT